MKQTIFYALCCLLAIAGTSPLHAQQLRNMPGDVKMPQKLTLTQPAPAKGSFTVAGNNVAYGFALPGTTVTLTLSPNSDYSVSDKLIKVYRTGYSYPAVSLDKTTNPQERTFTMPDYPVTIEVDFAAPLTAEMVSLSTSSSVTYNGADQKPTVTVTAGGTTLTAGTHYTLSWGTTDTWKDAGSYTLTVTPREEGGYSGDPVTKDFTITAAPLTATPDAGQVVYADETEYAPSYTVSGFMSGDESTAFTGRLQVGSDGKVANKNLSAGNNYTIQVTGDVSVARQTGNAADAVATLEGSSAAGENGWYNGSGTIVTLKAPAGFRIKETTAPATPSAAPVTSVSPTAPASLSLSQSLRNGAAADGYAAALTFTEEGEHTVQYTLKREVMNTESAAKSIDYKLDTGAPALSSVTTEGLKVTVKLADAVSGLASCSYTWEGGAAQTATVTSGAKEASFSIEDKAGTYHLTMTVKDMAGNVLSVPSTEVVLKAEGGTTPPDPVDPPVGPVDPEDPDTPDTPVDPDTPIDPDVPPVDPDTPVANESLSAGAQLTVFRNAFRLQTDRAATLYIFTISGRLQRSIPVTPGNTCVDDLPSGIYILRLSSGERWKVIIR